MPCEHPLLRLREAGDGVRDETLLNDDPVYLDGVFVLGSGRSMRSMAEGDGPTAAGIIP